MRSTRNGLSDRESMFYRRQGPLSVISIDLRQRMEERRDKGFQIADSPGFA
jgi:hypothetical protein